MLEKEGTEGEEEAKKAYFAAREVAEANHDADVVAEEKVSSALIEKVRNPLNACYSYNQDFYISRVCFQGNSCCQNYYWAFALKVKGRFMKSLEIRVQTAI